MCAFHACKAKEKNTNLWKYQEIFGLIQWLCKLCFCCKVWIEVWPIFYFIITYFLLYSKYWKRVFVEFWYLSKNWRTDIFVSWGVYLTFLICTGAFFLAIKLELFLNYNWGHEGSSCNMDCWTTKLAARRVGHLYNLRFNGLHYGSSSKLLFLIISILVWKAR